MNELEILQHYWWFLISVLGAALVFMLFVQGGQSMLCCARNETERQLIVNCLGRKWEITFTTLVVFGGAFFASFPLFYSTSFGGAYWLWMLILVSFVAQAVSYEYRRKRGNVYGTGFYDSLLMFNGLFGCVLLGVAVAMMFFGAEFTIDKGNILDGANPVISRWSATRGLEAIASWRNLLLGATVFFLARTLAALYFVNSISGEEALTRRMRRAATYNGLVFTALFVVFAVVLLSSSGLRLQADGTFAAEPYLYLHNMLSMWGAGAVFVLGVVAVLYGIARTTADSHWRKGIWYCGAGTIAVVTTLLLMAGWGDTAYYPSLLDPQCSLTITNSSSSEFTLRVMSYVSAFIPFVVGYIAYVWRKMNAKPLTPEELAGEPHQY
ncbi:MAG: cytochrome d ubiquinol oxidase subunit II [Muribaculaceae bacterium]|nr:cytochrome d ubiquinol oxidase subunit II [Muribaculaceae bacterium]